MAAATASNGRTARVPRAVASVQAPEQPAGSDLAGAVLDVQAKASKLVRNAVGQIQNRSYGYVTLDAVVDEVLPLLVDHDLLWRTFPTRGEDGEPALRYRMTHIPSGEYDEDVMALMLAKADPQGQGSALTYARRYALTAYLNLTVDPDDDGAAASRSIETGREPVDRYEQAATAHAELDKNSNSVQPTAAAPRRSERAATAKQRGMLEARARAAKLTPGDFANVVLSAAGDEPRTWRTEEHAAQTLARLLDRLPARLVTQVKEAIG